MNDLIDVNGLPINPSAEYYAARDAISAYIYALDEAKADRGHMYAMLAHLQSESQFTLTFLPPRK